MANSFKLDCSNSLTFACCVCVTTQRRKDFNPGLDFDFFEIALRLAKFNRKTYFLSQANLCLPSTEIRHSNLGDKVPVLLFHLIHCCAEIACKHALQAGQKVFF